MIFFNVIAFFFLIFNCAMKDVASKYYNNIEFNLENSNPKTEVCNTLIIFDLTKNVVSKEIFDISIKIFLKYILQYCNNFKYVAIDDQFNGCGTSNGCNITINNCVSSDGLEYANLVKAYSNTLFDDDPDDSKNYVFFFKKAFAETFPTDVPCRTNSVMLLTNRIVFFNVDRELLKIIDNSNIKVTAILLGRENATELLEQVYENIPNSQALNFPNYDCLSYLFYCLIPCSADKPGCMQEDINDCQELSKWTPNPNPDQTLHIWYVLDCTDGLGSSDVLDDGAYFNGLLSYIPWSGTLLDTRIGINAVIIITNYATTDFFNVINGETLQGQMYIYNRVSYYYYTSVLKNGTYFHFYNSDFNDTVPVYPIITENSQTTDVPSSTVATAAATNAAEHIPTSTVNSDTTTFQSFSHKPPKNANETLIICGGCLGALVIIFVIGFVIYRKRKHRIAFIQRMLLKTTHKRNAATNYFEKPTPDQWELKWDSLVIESDELHTGSNEQLLHGKLLKGIKQGIHDEDVDVAIKITNKHALPVTKSNFLNEINLMKTLSGQVNIVKMFGCITKGDEICMVLEFCANLDLHTFVRSLKYTKKELKKNEKVVKKEFFIFEWQISHGLISDFGLAIQSNKKNEIISNSDKRNFATKWLSPESLKDFKFSFSSDIWSIGIILFEMYSFGESPYAGFETEELLRFLEDGNRLQKPEFCSDEMYEIMLKCWMENPFKRPKSSELIKSFSQLLENTTEGYGYLEMYQTAVSKNNNELVQQFTVLEDVS